MRVVNFNCKKCGAELDKPVDDLSVYKCKYCGFENSLDNTIEIKFISQYAERDLRDVIKEKKLNARVLFENKKFHESYEAYLDLYELCPKDIEVLECLMLSYFHCYDCHEIKCRFKIFSKTYHEYFENYKEVQTDLAKYKEFEEVYKQVTRKRLFHLIEISAFAVISLIIIYFVCSNT